MGKIIDIVYSKLELLTGTLGGVVTLTAPEILTTLGSVTIACVIAFLTGVFTYLGKRFAEKYFKK